MIENPVKYRCLKYKCRYSNDLKSRLLADWKAKKCAARGCPALRSFIPRKKVISNEMV
jgi:hypothetical protein